MADIEDEGKMRIRESIPKIEKEIMRYFKGKRFAYLFTHGANGEYGHPRHRGVHRAVKTLLKKKAFVAGTVFTFSYRASASRASAIPGSRAPFASFLTRAYLNRKRNLIHSCYGFTKDSFEYKSCHRKEPFQNLSL